MIITTVKESRGEHNLKLNQLLNDVPDYKYMVLYLSDMNFGLAEDYYNNYDVVTINEMMTSKLAMKFDPPDAIIIEEFKKVRHNSHPK